MSDVAAVMRAEFFKAARKRRIYVLAALLWALLPLLMLLMGRLLQYNLSGSFVDEAELVGTLVQELASPFGIARGVLVAPSLLSPTFYIIAVALLAGFLIGEEKSHNMWKTVLTAQPNRAAVLAGKLIVAMALLAVLMTGGFVAGAAFGAVGTLFLDTHFGGDWLDLALLYGLQWLYAGAAVAFAFLLVFLTRNVSLGMVLVFFLPALVEGLYSIYRATVGVRPLTRLNALFQAVQLGDVVENLPRYFFTANLYAPSRRPLGHLVTVLGGDPVTLDGPLASLLRSDISLTHSGMVMLGYGLVFVVLLAWLFHRRDVS